MGRSAFAAAWVWTLLDVSRAIRHAYKRFRIRTTVAWPEDLLEDETGCYVSCQSSLFFCTAEFSSLLFIIVIFVVVPFGGLLSSVIALNRCPGPVEYRTELSDDEQRHVDDANYV